MVHEMRLHSEPFEDIRSSKQLIETRLEVKPIPEEIPRDIVDRD